MVLTVNKKTIDTFNKMNQNLYLLINNKENLSTLTQDFII